MLVIVNCINYQFQMVLEQLIQVQTGALQLSCGGTMMNLSLKNLLPKRHLFPRYPGSVKEYSVAVGTNPHTVSLCYNLTI